MLMLMLMLWPIGPAGQLKDVAGQEAPATSFFLGILRPGQSTVRKRHEGSALTSTQKSFLLWRFPMRCLPAPLSLVAT